MKRLMCAQSLSNARLFLTLWIVACQAFLCPWNFPGKNNWNGLPFPFLGDLPDTGIKSTSPTLHVDSLPARHHGSPNSLLFYFLYCYNTTHASLKGKKKSISSRILKMAQNHAKQFTSLLHQNVLYIYFSLPWNRKHVFLSHITECGIVNTSFYMLYRIYVTFLKTFVLFS